METISKSKSLFLIELDRCKGSKSYSDYTRIKGMIPPCSPKEYQKYIKLACIKLT